MRVATVSDGARFPLVQPAQLIRDQETTPHPPLATAVARELAEEEVRVITRLPGAPQSDSRQCPWDTEGTRVGLVIHHPGECSLYRCLQRLRAMKRAKHRRKSEYTTW
jgi:hypothetical protein